MIGEEFEVVRAVNNPNNEGQAYEVLFDGFPSYIEYDDAEVVFEEFKQ